MGLSVSESSASKMKKEAIESVLQNKTSRPENNKVPGTLPQQRTSLVEPILPPDSEAKINGPKQTSMRIHPEPQSLSSGSSLFNLSSKKSLNEIKQMKILSENMVSVDRVQAASKIKQKREESRISEEGGGEVETKIKQYTLNPNTREAICGSNAEGKTRRQLMKDVAQGRRDTMEDPFLNCLACSRPDFQIGNPLNRYRKN